MIKKTIISGLLISCSIFNSFAGEESLVKKTTLSFENNKPSQFSKRRSHGGDKVIGVGGQVSVLKLFGGNPTLIGFGVNGLLSLDGEKNAFFGDFSYYLPGTQTSTDYAYAHSSLTYPSQMTIDVKTKISGMGLRVGFRRYFINEVSDEGFKIYMQAAAGVLLFKGSSVASGYDSELYYTTIEPESTATGFTIGGGFGGEYSLASKLNIFAEANMNVPANQANGEAIEVEIPFSAQMLIGARFHF